MDKPENNSETKAPAAEATKEKEPEQAKAKQVTAKKTGWFFRTVSIIVFIATVLGFSWLLLEQQNRLEALSAQQNLSEQIQLQQLTELEASIAEQLLVNESLAEALDERTLELQMLGQELAALRLGINTERSGSDRSWMLSEAASNLRLGRQYLELLNDAATASRLYLSADALLQQIDDPSIRAIRALMAADISRLQATESIDLEGIFFSLSALSDRISAVQLRSANERDSFISQTVTEENQAGFFAGLIDDLSQYFVIRRLDEPLQALLSNEDINLLRQNMQLQIEQAKLALIQGREELYQESLASVEALVEQYVSRENNQQASMMQSLQDLQNTRIRTEIPDLSNSLNLLQDLLARTNAGRQESDNGQEGGLQ